MKRAHLYIQGRVQGVSFRYYTREEARSADVTGWVRNLWDGRVEAVFEGEQAAVERMVAWCRRGPPSARVTEVDVSWETPSGEYEGFEVRMTAGGW